MMIKISRVLAGSRLLIIIAVIIIFMAVWEPSFFNTANLVNIFSHVSINGILAVGMTLLMISRAFDISIGSIMVLSGVITIMTVNNFSPVIGIVAGLFSGIVMGLINGILVAKMKINSFIATLGTMVIYQGIAFALTDMKSVTTDSLSFQKFSSAEIFHVPIVIIYFFLIALITGFVSRYTKLGKNAYAIGGNEEACRMLGVNVESHRLVYFITSGVCASFAGILLSSKISAASGIFGENVALVVIAGIVLGGVHLTGGVGTVIGVVQAIVLLQFLENVTVYLGLFGYYQLFFRSILLIGIVVFDVIYIKRADKKLEKQELIQIRSEIDLQNS
jgi:ribose/xylose/arabinose/galactoside ABC-type transport system permease subunit